MKPFFLILLFLSAIPLLSQGQSFQFKANVAPVQQGGFYRISLSPEVLGQLDANLTDIRMYDERRQEVPYLLKHEQPVQYKTLFKEYEIISKVMTPKVSTSLVLRNAAKSRINNLSLIIKNANVRKKAKLSGSNDAKTWYVIEEAYTLEAMYSATATSEVKILDFPLSDYEYYQLEINDSLSAPLNIQRVGYYDAYAENGKYASISGLSFTKIDSSTARQTYVHVSITNAARLDKVSIEVSEPALYRRQASLCVAEWRKIKRKKRQLVYEPIAQLELSSATENTIYLSGWKAKDFYLVIENEDNPPLSIGKVEAYQLNTYLIAELKQGQAYHLEFGDEKANAPSYDLRYFEDKIPANLPTVQVTKMVSLITPTDVHSPDFFTSPLFIWGAMGVVLLILSYMSYQMLKEMGDKNKVKQD